MLGRADAASGSSCWPRFCCGLRSWGCCCCWDLRCWGSSSCCCRCCCSRLPCCGLAGCAARAAAGCCAAVAPAAVGRAAGLAGAAAPSGLPSGEVPKSTVNGCAAPFSPATAAGCAADGAAGGPPKGAPGMPPKGKPGRRACRAASLACMERVRRRGGGRVKKGSTGSALPTQLQAQARCRQRAAGCRRSGCWDAHLVVLEGTQRPLGAAALQVELAVQQALLAARHCDHALRGSSTWCASVGRAACSWARAVPQPGRARLGRRPGSSPGHGGMGKPPPWCRFLAGRTCSPLSCVCRRPAAWCVACAGGVSGRVVSSGAWLQACQPDQGPDLAGALTSRRWLPGCASAVGRGWAIRRVQRGPPGAQPRAPAWPAVVGDAMLRPLGVALGPGGQGEGRWGNDATHHNLPAGPGQLERQKTNSLGAAARSSVQAGAGCSRMTGQAAGGRRTT